MNPFTDDVPDDALVPAFTGGNPFSFSSEEGSPRRQSPENVPASLFAPRALAPVLPPLPADANPFGPPTPGRNAADGGEALGDRALSGGADAEPTVPLLAPPAEPEPRSRAAPPLRTAAREITVRPPSLLADLETGLLTLLESGAHS